MASLEDRATKKDSTRSMGTVVIMPKKKKESMGTTVIRPENNKKPDIIELRKATNEKAPDDTELITEIKTEEPTETDPAILEQKKKAIEALNTELNKINTDLLSLEVKAKANETEQNRKIIETTSSVEDLLAKQIRELLLSNQTIKNLDAIESIESVEIEGDPKNEYAVARTTFTVKVKMPLRMLFSHDELPVVAAVTFKNKSDGTNIEVLESHAESSWAVNSTRGKIDKAFDDELEDFSEKFEKSVHLEMGSEIKNIQIRNGKLQATLKGIAEIPKINIDDNAEKFLEQKKKLLENEIVSLKEELDVLIAKKTETEKNKLEKEPLQKEEVLEEPMPQNSIEGEAESSATNPVEEILKQIANNPDSKISYTSFADKAANGIYEIKHLAGENKYLIKSEKWGTFKLTEENFKEFLGVGTVTVLPNEENINVAAGEEIVEIKNEPAIEGETKIETEQISKKEEAKEKPETIIEMTPSQIDAVVKEMRRKIWGPHEDLQKLRNNETKIAFKNPEAWEKVKSILDMPQNSLDIVVKNWEGLAKDPAQKKVQTTVLKLLSTLGEALKVKIEKKESVEESISDEEYNKFIDKNEVSENVLEKIARATVAQEPLSEREIAIYQYNAKKVEQKIKELGINTSSQENPKITSHEGLNKLFARIKEQETQKENLVKDWDEHDSLENQTADEFRKSMEQLAELDQTKIKLNQEKNILEHDLKFAGKETTVESKERSRKKNLNEAVNQEAKEMVDEFIKEFKMTKLPPEFENLSVEQKLFVVRDLKKQVVDIVKEDAQTKYSEEMKAKILSKVKTDSAWRDAIKNIKIGAKNVFTKIKGIKNKEFDMNRIEGKVFKKLQDTEEGKKLINDNIKLLAENTKDQRIGYDEEEKNFHILYVGTEDVPGCTEKEEQAILKFNRAANKFRSAPYEWGQRSKSSREYKTYNETKAQYEKARGEMSIIKAKRDGEKNAELGLAQLNSAIEMEQVLTTHPEFEKELNDIGEYAEGKGKGKAFWKTMGNLGNTVTGGKSKLNNATNKALFLTGVGMRKGAGALATKSAYALGWVAAPVTGAVIGGIKANFKAREKLRENKENARYGKNIRTATGKMAEEQGISRLQKELSEAEEIGDVRGAKRIRKTLEDLEKKRMAAGKAEVGNFTDVTRLTKRFEDLTNELGKSFGEINPNETAIEKERRLKRLALLSASIKHAIGKKDKGEVNFGDAKSKPANSINFAIALNKAMVLEASLSENVTEAMNDRMNELLNSRAETIKTETSQARHNFIVKQTKQGAFIGAGAATLGYVYRDVLGWGGHHGNIEKNSEAIKIIQPKTIDEDTIPVSAIDSTTHVLPQIQDSTVTEPMDLDSANNVTEQAHAFVNPIRPHEHIKPELGHTTHHEHHHPKKQHEVAHNTEPEHIAKTETDLKKSIEQKLDTTQEKIVNKDNIVTGNENSVHIEKPGTVNGYKHAVNNDNYDQDKMPPQNMNGGEIPGVVQGYRHAINYPEPQRMPGDEMAGRVNGYNNQNMPPVNYYGMPRRPGRFERIVNIFRRRPR